MMRREVPVQTVASPMVDPLESFIAFHCRTPVFSTARNHYRTGRDTLRVCKLDFERIAVAVQGLHFDRNSNVRAEFLCLVKRSPGQRLTRDSGRKTEVIFDARTRA